MYHQIKELLSEDKFHEALIRMKVILGINIDEFAKRLLAIQTLGKSRANWKIVMNQYSQLSLDMLRAIDEAE